MIINRQSSTSFDLFGVTQEEMGILLALVGQLTSHFDLYKTFSNAAQGYVPKVKVGRLYIGEGFEVEVLDEMTTFKEPL
jgi:hypothetical protein